MLVDSKTVLNYNEFGVEVGGDYSFPLLKIFTWWKCNRYLHGNYDRQNFKCELNISDICLIYLKYCIGFFMSLKERKITIDA